MFKKIIFMALISLIALRLGIWKFFPTMDFSIKDELSNMIVAGAIFCLAAVFYGHKAICRERLVRIGIEGPLALFIVAAAVSMAWTADVAASIKALVMLVAYVLFFAMLFEILLVRGIDKVFFWFFILASVVVSLFGINDIIYLNSVSPQTIESARLTNESLYYILVNKRACSLFGWPNVLAGFLMLGMPLAAGLFFTFRHWAWRLACIIAAGVMVTAFFFTFSFLGWSGFLVASLAALMVVWRGNFFRISPLMKRWLLAGLVGMMFLFLLVIARKNFQSAIAPRKEYVRVVGQVIAQHPWRGIGFGAYRAASMQFVTSRTGLTGFAHNTYLQVWAETGLAGLVAIIWMMVILARSAFLAWGWKRERDARMMLWVVSWGMFAFFFDNLNSFTMLKPNSSFFFWTWLAVFCSMVYRPDPVPAVGGGRARWPAAAVVAVCMAGIFLSWRCGGYLQGLMQGAQAINAGRLPEGRILLGRVQPFDPLDVRAWTVLGTSYIQEFRRTHKPETLGLARRAFEQAIELAPNFYHSYLVLNRIYLAQGDPGRASLMYRKALEVSPYETRRDVLLSETGKRE